MGLKVFAGNPNLRFFCFFFWIFFCFLLFAFRCFSAFLGFSAFALLCFSASLLFRPCRQRNRKQWEQLMGVYQLEA